MWFAKLFGGGKEDDRDDEPARYPPASETRPAQPAAAPKTAVKAKPIGPATTKGFDPYNSGAFKRRNAWERVSRR